MIVSCTAYADPLKIRIWSGFPPGGTTGNIARQLQQSFQNEDPTATVVVEYATGAAGVIGLKKLTSLGQTQYVELLVDGYNQMITAYLTGNNPVNLDKDVHVVAPIGYTQMVIMSSKASKITDIKTFTALAKERKINFASAGFGSVTFSTTAYMAYKTNTMKDVVHVPYKGTGEFYIDLINGNIDIASDYVASGSQLVVNGSVSAIGVTGNHRSQLMPEVKTLKEQGIQYPLNPWFGVFTNNTVDSDKLAQVKYLLVKVLSNSSTVKQLHTMGIETYSPEDISRADKWYTEEKQNFKRISAVLRPAVNSIQ